jgi:hypothetical protein
MPAFLSGQHEGMIACVVIGRTWVGCKEEPPAWRSVAKGFRLAGLNRVPHPTQWLEPGSPGTHVLN